MKIVKYLASTGIYFYVATILTQYGYNTYFGIPYNFIEFSLKDNVIFFFNLFKIAMGVVRGLSVWILLFLTLLFLLISFLVTFNIIHKKIVTLFIIIIAILSFQGFYNFGYLIAKSETEFHILSDNCNLHKENTTYVIPTFYQTTAIITPIYTDSNKLTGEFLTKDSSELNCEIQTKSIGKIFKE